MKMNINKHLFILMSLISLSTFAQSKKTLNYQAVILDPKAIDIPGASITGQPLNKGNVCLRFSLLNTQGGLDYEETQQVTTDEFGLVSVAIGTGTKGQAGNSTSIYKSFESIVWNASVKSLKVSVSYDGCSSFKQVSTQVFNYTPYALYAEAVDYKNVRDAPTKLSQFSNDAGYLVPKDLDPLKTDIKTNSSQIEAANQTIADNKKTSDLAFLVVNQTIRSLDKQVAENTNLITTINTKLTEQQNQIVDNRNQITATNNTMNAQIGGLQGQLNITNSTVSNLSGVAEMQSNKSTAEDLGGANPSDQAYPSQKAAKAYVDQVVSQIATSGVPDATTLAAGKVQLAGDLGGTATNPTVPALANKENTANKSLNVLADGSDNTKYPSVKAVKDYVDQATLGTALAADLANKANITSPAFTGVPTAPTPTLVDNSTQIATTAFVQSKVNAATVNDATSSAKGILELDGDLGGTASSPLIAKIQGSPVSSVAPTTGQVLTYNGASWAPASGTLSGIVSIANGGTGSSTQSFVDLSTNQIIAGNKVFSSDIFVNAVRVGKGAGNFNLTYGKDAFEGYSNGEYNTAIGHRTLRSNATGGNNVAIGYDAMYLNSSGSSNTAIGNGAIYYNSSNDGITAIGWHALHAEQGANNVAVGSGAGARGNVSSSLTNSTFLGTGANANNGTIDNATAIGFGAVVTASDKIQLGNASITNVNTSGTITAGDVTYPKTHGTSNQVLTTTGNGTLTWSSSPSINANLNDQTGTSYTLQSSDNGKVVTLNNASAITLTVPSGLGAGYNCMIVQKGAGLVTIAASGVTVANRIGFTKTAGTNAIVTIVSIATNYFITGGDMQ
jgi:uncharacterized coiled-coil protein SlyX